MCIFAKNFIEFIAALEHRKKTFLMTLFLLSFLTTGMSVVSSSASAQEVPLPAFFETTTHLNVREYNSTSARVVGVMQPRTRFVVDYFMDNGWAAIKYNGSRAYVSGKYIKFIQPVTSTTPVHAKSHSHRKRKSLVGSLFSIALSLFFLVILQKVSFYFLGIVCLVMYWLYWVICLPFMALNALQRFLSKPWYPFIKFNHCSDSTNAAKRERFDKIKIPLYIVSTPLRFVNAFYFNMVAHCGFELLNYLLEVVVPTNPKEGEDNYLLVIVLLPWRFVRYVCYHGFLTVVESAAWTVVDTFVPALTLYHGTDAGAAVQITGAGRDGNKGRLTGIWNVGGGNWAGNGIYFGTARSTALHYSAGALIVCRVSPGKVLDLGLAPKSVYNACGHPNATAATNWGLNHGYVTGEWWRPDEGWWEYCMYDWKNRYNYSWRIRPLYVINLGDERMQRVPGGMSHWLFRKLVIDDIASYVRKISRR